MELGQPVRYAGFWIRLGATGVDVALILILTWPLLLSIYGAAYFESQEIVHGKADLLISYILPAIVVIVFWKYKSATPGKMIFGMRIVDAKSGQSLSTRQCIVRYFAYIASMLPMGLGFLWIAWDPRKQAWHDKIAGTVVVLGD